MNLLPMTSNINRSRFGPCTLISALVVRIVDCRRWYCTLLTYHHCIFMVNILAYKRYCSMQIYAFPLNTGPLCQTTCSYGLLIFKIRREETSQMYKADWKMKTQLKHNRYAMVVEPVYNQMSTMNTCTSTFFKYMYMAHTTATMLYPGTSCFHMCTILILIGSMGTLSWSNKNCQR